MPYSDDVYVASLSPAKLWVHIKRIERILEYMEGESIESLDHKAQLAKDAEDEAQMTGDNR